MMKRFNAICSNQKSSTVKHILFLLMLLAFSACKEEPLSFQDPVRQVLMLDMIKQDTSLSIAVEALEKAKMAATLNTYGPFTFFAPDNGAFRKYFRNQGKSSLSDYTEEEIKTLMTYHILPARLKAAQFIQGPQSIPTGRGDYITLDISKGFKSNTLVNGKAKAYETDIEYSNGYLHKMDGVLDPPTLTIGQFLQQNQDKYSILIGGLQRAGLMDTLVNLTNATNDRTRITLFAETNDILQQAGINSFDNMPLDELKTLMQYHIIQGANFSSSYTFFTPAIPQINIVERWDNTIVSLNKQDYIYFNLAGTKLINNETIDFAASDIIMRNGVLHNLDKHMVFNPQIKRTQILHVFSSATNFLYGVPGFSSTTPPVANASSGNWRTYTESGTGTSRGSLIMLFANPDTQNDSLVTIVRNVRKGKYKIEVNYKNGSRGDYQLVHNGEKIGVPMNYGSGTTWQQKLVIGTYDFKTTGDRRLAFVCTRVGGINLDCMVLTPVYD